MKGMLDKVNQLACLVVLGLPILACESQDDTFSEFVKHGETIYIGKADTVSVAPGFNKLRFSVALNADPKISKGLLETTDGSVEHEFDINRTGNGRDTITFDLELEEGEYIFGLYLMDGAGHRSIRYEVPTRVFGEHYQATLLNRRITSIAAFADNVTLNWSDAAPGTIATALTYEDRAGMMQLRNVANDETQTLIESYKIGGAIQVSSTYKPAENAIEVFGAVPSETNFPNEFLLNKSIITALELSADATDGCFGSSYARLTDGATGQFWHSCNIPEDQYPWVMSFDMGVAVHLSRFRLDERSACCGGRSPAAYQIWGINDLAGAVTADIDAGTVADWEADAVAKGWVKLLDVTGNNQPTFEVEVPESTMKFRYFRIVGISSIDGDINANFDEFTFWATGIE